MATDTSERQVQELYIAYFGRPADASGLAYYANELDKGTKDVAEIALGFGGSAEAAPIVALDTDKYVEALYLQAFGRDYNAETDSTFWVDSIASGVYTKEMAMVEILNGASGNDATAVANKGRVAATFTTAQETNEKAYDVDVLNAAKALMSGVTAEANTLTAGTSAATVAVANAAPLTAAAAADLLSIIATAELGAAEVAQAAAVASAAKLSADAAGAASDAAVAVAVAAAAAQALAEAIAVGDVAAVAAATVANTAAKADTKAKATLSKSAEELSVAQLNIVNIAIAAAAGAQNVAALATAYGTALDGGDLAAIAAAKSEQSTANAAFDTVYASYNTNVKALGKSVVAAEALGRADKAVSAAKAGGDPDIIASANAARDVAVFEQQISTINASAAANSAAADPNGMIAAAAANAHAAAMVEAAAIAEASKPQSVVAAEALSRADEAVSAAKAGGDPDIIASANAARDVAVALRDATLYGDAPSAGGATFEEQISTINAAAAANVAAADPNDMRGAAIAADKAASDKLHAEHVAAAAADTANIARLAEAAAIAEAAKPQSVVAAEALGKADEALAAAKSGGDPDIIAAANASREAAVVLRDAALYLAVANKVTFHADVLAVDDLFAAAASSASLEAVTEFDYSPEPDLFIQQCWLGQIRGHELGRSIVQGRLQLLSVIRGM